MYHGGEVKKRINPKEKANIFSLITFFYTNDILRRGYRKDIEENDVYEVLSRLKSKPLGDEIETEWTKHKTERKKISSISLMLSCYGRHYLFLGFVQMIMKIGYAMLLPQALSKVVGYFTRNKDGISRQEAILYAVLLISLNIVNSTYLHNYMLLITELGFRIRTAFCSLIYRKALKLSPAALADITVGKIVTLISKDVYSFESAILFANDMWIGLILTVIITYILFVRLGVATFAGIGFFVIVIPLQMGLGKLTTNLRIEAAKLTDDRLQVTQETLSAIKIVKMYTWEKIFGIKISKAREEEVSKIKNIYYAKAVSLITGGLVSSIAFYLLVMTYVWAGNNISAADIFFVTACFHTLRSTIMISIPLGISQSAEAFASANRIDKVLNAEELEPPKRNVHEKPMILMKEVGVKIKESVILKNVNLEINSGFTLITGPIGGGKSSLMKAILEDYPVTEGEMKIQGSVSYASEEPWLFPSSIKQNIVFGQEFNEERYQKVLEICALKQDVSTFEQGDGTIVGDRGLNLSKGQQARINLARSVYYDADIYLFDDCLSSLDTQVQDFVFDQCIKNFLANKICILVSHQPSHLDDADNVVVMENGTIKSSAKPSEMPKEEIENILAKEEPEIILDTIKIPEQEVKREKETSTEEGEEEEESLIPKDAKITNIYHEDKKTGKVDIDIYKKYFHYGGGIPIFIAIFVLFIIAQGAASYTDKLVSNWANIEQNLTDFKKNNLTNTTEYQQCLEKHTKFLTTYTIMIVVTTSLFLLRALAHFQFSSRASVNLHRTMGNAILNSVMEFFDSHYIGNILNRFSKDLGTIDEYLPFVIYENLRLICLLTGIIIVIATVNLHFLLPAALFFVFLYFVRNYYMPTGRSLKRLDSATRSPVIGHLNASLDGLTTIRACGTQDILRSEFDKHQDLYTSASFMLQCASRAFGFSLDMLCSFFVASIIARFIITDTNAQAGNVGLAITQAIMLIGLLQWGIRQWAELENQMTSVERIVEYTDIKEENKTGQILTDWPSNGKIQYINMSLTYNTSKGEVLKNINFTVNPREKIGIVGRTGAGKSSIIATLFRLYESQQGQILIDDVDIKTLSLEFLRSNIAIIPQDPVLFLGTIRSNIDPTGRYSDEEIWKALQTANLRDLVASLDFTITEGGSNFSSGQRQLICLARAVVSKNKIIVLDEATANMDQETDALIHNTIKESFAHCTVLTIAHRLHSVLKSDKVMVVDKGEIVEYDAPNELLKNKNGMFYKMVKQIR